MIFVEKTLPGGFFEDYPKTDLLHMVKSFFYTFKKIIWRENVHMIVRNDSSIVELAEQKCTTHVLSWFVFFQKLWLGNSATLWGQQFSSRSNLLRHLERIPSHRYTGMDFSRLPRKSANDGRYRHGISESFKLYSNAIEGSKETNPNILVGSRSNFVLRSIGTQWNCSSEGNKISRYSPWL